VCGKSGFEVLFRQNFTALEKGGLIDGYDVVTCSSCGTAYAHGIPAQAELDAYYRELSKYDYAYRNGQESEDDTNRLKEMARVLESAIPDASSRVFEVGCANGRLLALLKEAGYQDVVGLDPSPGCARAAMDLYGVPVVTGTIFELPAREVHYDFVIALGVLEHIRDVGRAAQIIRSGLSDHGRVYVEVPDATSLDARQDAPFQEFSTEHINFFSPRALQYLMERAGFTTVTCASVPRELHRGSHTLVVSGLFQRSTSDRTEFPFDASSREGLLRYISECESIDASLRRRLSQAVAGRSVILWGLGTHTRRLLANQVLPHGSIAAFVDSNPKYQGQQVLEVPVLSPNAVATRSEPIVISSYAFQNEIAKQIREELGLRNELILLYE
jgi:SAM-dependent methyltransferase